MTKTLVCPECQSERVAVTAEQMWMVNTGDHYCHSVKTHDSDAVVDCLDCSWQGMRHQLSLPESAKSETQPALSLISETL
jgi:transcription elongation factor Elf1